MPGLYKEYVEKITSTLQNTLALANGAATGRGEDQRATEEAGGYREAVVYDREGNVILAVEDEEDP